MLDVRCLFYNELSRRLVGFMNRNAKTLLCLIVGLTLPLAVPSSMQAANTGTQNNTHKTDDQSEKQDSEIRGVLINLANAVNAGDAEKVSLLWSQNAVFIDDSGEETQGRAALQSKFSEAFKQRNASSLELHPDKISLPAPNVAFVVGEVSRKSSALDLPIARFSLVLVRQNDSWLVNEATETAIQSTRPADHLKELEWLIGKWQVDKPDHATTLDVQWGAGRNFIVSKCVTNRNGEEQVDTQVIGWDPRTKSIVSWHFDCNGGFGYGKWGKQSNHWLVDFAGVGVDGSANRATNVFTVSNPDEFTWQSTEQSADGVAIADTEALKVKRTKL